VVESERDCGEGARMNKGRQGCGERGMKGKGEGEMERLSPTRE
jgi:hypothetical protein